MLLILLAYLGGALTIASPCILPVLPFVFARAGQPFFKSALPMLVGMASTFCFVATLAAIGGGWAVHANQYGRMVALAVLAIFGLTLIFPHLADKLMGPLVRLGSRLSQTESHTNNTSIMPSFFLGIATGLLWAPCAGPILGLILTGAALQGATIQTSLLLLAYALGAATSLALALLVGGRVFKAMKKSLGVGEWIRRVLGIVVLIAVACIALGVDTGVLTRLSLTNTSTWEQNLLTRFNMDDSGKPMTLTGDLPVEGTLPSLSGATEWFNSPPLTPEQLKGKVVLVDFWTYSCINCLRSIPYVRAWADKYKKDGLVVIGVHAPEFAFEKDPSNVKQAIEDLLITYPVAMDNNYAIWRGFNNRYWPAHYFIDAKGKIRYHHFGEGEYDESEKVIQQLLKEAGTLSSSTPPVSIVGGGVLAASNQEDVQSPETYIGSSRAENFISTRNPSGEYTLMAPRLNEWGLKGNWNVGEEQATLTTPGGSIIYNFHARDLHLVMGPGPNGKPIPFTVTIDGQAPGLAHGEDTDPNGAGTVTNQRLYQLIRQTEPITDHTFEIHFMEPGVQAFAFTFG